MASGVISIGGLATGLDTNSIITKLVALEKRPLDLLTAQISDANQTKSALSTLSTKLLALKSAADALASSDKVLARKASSSDATVATAAAGLGAQRGTASITVERLAHGSVAGATVGVLSSTATVAAGAGTFRFQVGNGEVQQVDVDGTTTLQDLAAKISALGAGATATAVNFGTDATPDWRLQIATTATGESSTITIVKDDTSLAVQTAQTGQNARFTVSGFSSTFERESNTFSDVLSGVTISLKDEGKTTLAVDDDTDAIVGKVKALVTAYNDIQTYVASQSEVSGDQGADQLTIGALANNSTVRTLMSRVQDTLSQVVPGATGKYVNLSSVGIATQRDGTVVLNEDKFRSALTADPKSVASVFSGYDGGKGVANNLSSLLGELTGATGAMSSAQKSVDDRVKALQDTVDAGTRRLTAFEDNLRQQFSALEQLVAQLQSQSSYLASLFTSL